MLLCYTISIKIVFYGLIHLDFTVILDWQFSDCIMMDKLISLILIFGK
jgi:hypothetical protein